MAKLEIPIHVYMDELEEIINELKHLQTYKLFEGDDMVLIDCDTAVEIFANHLRTEIRDTQTIKPAQQWIPVIERLPEKTEKSYWVCLESGGQCQCRWTNNMYGLGSNEWSKWGWHIMDKPQYATVIAWRELPEPYKGEEHGED